MSSDEAAGSAGPSSSKGPLFLALINTLAIIAVAGAMVYVLLIFKRPAITEHAERTRLEEKHSKPAISTQPGRMDFERTTVNIKGEGGEAAGITKLHYVLVRFSLQLRQDTMLTRLEPYKAVIADKVLELIGNRDVESLNTVQGRYLLKTDIPRELNAMANHVLQMEPPVFTQVYFTEFLVQ